MPNLAAPAPRVEEATAFAAPKEDSVMNAATVPPQVEEASAVPAIPVQAPRVEPVRNTDDEEEEARFKNDNNTHDMQQSSSIISASRFIKTSPFHTHAAVYAVPTRKKKYPAFIRQVLLLLNDDRVFVSYGEIKRFIIIHEKLCYVYLEETSQKPLYIIDLEKYKCLVDKDSDDPNPNCAIISPDVNCCYKNGKNAVSVTNVMLVNDGREIVFQLAFKSDDDVYSFLKAVDSCSK